jgi:PhnB protein
MINPNLKFNGVAEQAFNFYKAALGGEFISIQRFSDTPHGASMPAQDQNKIMYISLKTSKGIISGNDHLDMMGGPLKQGNNFSLAVQTDSEAEADKIFKDLSEGGTVTVPIGKVFWGAYFGMLTDKFGVEWMVNHQYAV